MSSTRTLRGARELLGDVRRQRARLAGEKGIDLRRRHAGVLRPLRGAQAVRRHEGAERLALRVAASAGRGAATSPISIFGLARRDFATGGSGLDGLLPGAV